jgi:septal ring factor EnvC (AmiA/AmiB activator)
VAAFNPAFGTMKNLCQIGLILSSYHFEYIHISKVMTSKRSRTDESKESTPSFKRARKVAEYLEHRFGGISINQRESDGFLDATNMCKTNKKKLFKDYMRLKSTKEFHKALSANGGITPLELVESKVGGNHSGTWVHPKVAIHLAMWISPAFAVHVIDWVFRFISGDPSLVGEVAARVEDVNRKELDEAMDKIALLQMSLNDAQAENLELVSMLTSLENENSNLDIEVTSARAQAELIREAVHEANEQIDKLKSEKQAAYDTLKNMNKQYKKAVADADRMNAVLMSREENLKSLTTQYENLSKAMDEARTKFNAMEQSETDAKIEAKKALTELRGIKIRASEKFKYLNEKIKETHQRLKQEMRDCKKINKDLNVAKEKLADTRNELRESKKEATDAKNDRRVAIDRYNAMVELGRVGLDCLKQTGRYISQPTRFTAVNLGPLGGWESNGGERFDLRTVIKNMYENMAYSIFQMSLHGICLDGEMIQVLAHATNDPELEINNIKSPVSIKMGIYGSVRKILGLKHSTYATIRQAYEISTRYNSVIETMYDQRSVGYHLIQPNDIRLLMRYNPNVEPVIEPPVVRIRLRQPRIVGFLLQ